MNNRSVLEPYESQVHGQTSAAQGCPDLCGGDEAAHYTTSKMMILDSQQIIEGLSKSGGVLLWSIDMGCDHVTMTKALTAWRKRASDRERHEVALALDASGLPHQTILGVTGWSQRRAQEQRRAPELSYADMRADAAQIAKWGYV